MHCHVQICYKNAEDLLGFDPHSAEDREFCHKLLDEYLNVIQKRYDELKAEGKTEGRELTEDEDAGFHIWPNIDSH